MSDQFEDALKRWLGQRAGDDQPAIQALAGNVAVLPPRRGRQQRLVPIAASIALFVGLAWVASPRFATISNEAASTPTNAVETSPAPTPGGPAAFADDPRLARCYGTADDMEFVFVMTHGRDYQRYLPNMLLAPELDLDDPTFVVVYREGWRPEILNRVGSVVESPTPGHRTVCVLLPGGEPTLYGDVDITGLTVDVIPSTPTPSPSPPAAIPGNPYAFLDDPRLPLCYFTGRPNQMEWVFEITIANDHGLFPANPGLAGDLDEHGAALVVVYRADMPVPPDYGPGPQVQRTAAPGQRVVCLVFDDGVLSQTGLDITGLDSAALPTGPTLLPASEPPDQSTGPTPTPAPAWFAGAQVLLGCDGEPSGFGVGWQPGDLGTSPSSSAERALENLIDRIWLVTAPFPTEDFRLFDSTADAAAYTFGYRGAVRAVVIARSDAPDGTGIWRITDVAACEPSEYGVGLPIGAEFGGWRDATGSIVSGDVVSERQDCYDGIQLRVEGRLFVWDPELGAGSIYDPAQLESTFSADAGLPADAVDTGYTSGGRRLHLAADGKAAFLVSRDGSMQWPHVRGDEYQRTDCN
jgi:hypothetical protein